MPDHKTTLFQLHTDMRACRLCFEAGHAIVPGAVFRGSAGARVMLIGQAPGVTEVEAKRPFNAGSAKLRDVIGTAAYFPPEALVNPVNFDLNQAELLAKFDGSKDENGRWVVPLPHPRAR